MKLVKYDAARRAIAAAVKVDEVKRVRDQAIAMKLYARLAKDEQLGRDAQAIRLRAERALGIMIDKQRKTVGLAKGHRFTGGVSKTPPEEPLPTLAEVGIDKNMAKRARQLATIPEEKFDTIIEELRDPPPPPERKPEKRQARSTRGGTFEVIEPTIRDIFLHNATTAMEAAVRNYDDLEVDDEVLDMARRAAEEWARCFKRIEERCGTAPTSHVRPDDGDPDARTEATEPPAGMGSDEDDSRTQTSKDAPAADDELAFPRFLVRKRGAVSPPPSRPTLEK